MQQSYEITISGQVQGVGFRPFIYKLAHLNRFSGFVCNTEEGVLIHINTSRREAHSFLEAIVDQAPVISTIQSHSLKEITYQKYDDFNILPSKSKGQINIPLTPDFAICESCKAEISDKENRRYGYAFTTCTQCGPRYALTTKFPFERSHTTLASFEMCTSCTSEYKNPEDRRFHSQTNSCRDCGIKLTMTNSSGIEIKIAQEVMISRVAKLLLEGNIVAIKNTNGYLLCCDANNKAAISSLRKRKKRPSKPFALLYPSLKDVKKSFHLSRQEEKALTAPVAPIVIVEPKNDLRGVEQELIAPGLKQLGVMLPSSALLCLLMQALQIPIVATSGNIHGSPIIADEVTANKKLSGVADFFLNHNLKIAFPQDDSVVRFAEDQPIWLRRSRGLAPNYLKAKTSGKQNTLALGAHLKSTFLLKPNEHLYLSQYMGNLDSYEVSERFEQNLKQFLELFSWDPEAILIDNHPQYQSSMLGRKYAEEGNTEIFSVQHHKAHFASVLAEHKLFDSNEGILGVVWDGTGLGEDGAIWGGEFFSYKHFELKRLGHFEYVDWLAGDKMAKEPRLSLLSMLPDTERDTIQDKFSESEWKLYLQLLSGNKLKTSSVGRLFDAVASYLDILDKTSYEGEAAMLLENLAANYHEEDYIDFLGGRSFTNAPVRYILGQVGEAIRKGIPRERIANSFIHTLALLIVRIAEKNNLEIVACSGGVFQNSLLVKKLLDLTAGLSIELKFNRILSCNDENIAFGQHAYYQHFK